MVRAKKNGNNRVVKADLKNNSEDDRYVRK